MLTPCCRVLPASGLVLSLLQSRSAEPKMALTAAAGFHQPFGVQLSGECLRFSISRRSPAEGRNAASAIFAGHWTGSGRLMGLTSPFRMQPHNRSANGDVTGLLRVWSDGDEHAFERLIPLVYDELHRMALRYLAGERSTSHSSRRRSSTRSAFDCSAGIRRAGRTAATSSASLRR